MRKFTLLAILLLVLSAAFPTFAQDEEPTIADLVVSLASADEAEFTVLLAAVSAADPLFLEVLSDPEVGVTVFAPTDAAFVALLEALGVSAEDLLADTELLNAVLAYHVVPGVFGAEYFIELLSEEADGVTVIGTLLPDFYLTLSLTDTVVVDESNVVIADVEAANGVVHVIDAVLVPDFDMMDDMMGDEPTSSIAEIVIELANADEAEFTILLAAVLAADESIVEMLSSDGLMTVFAPTDAAFVALLEALGVSAEELLGNTELLNTVLAYHVVPGYFSAAAIVDGIEMNEEGFNIATYIPASLSFALDGGVVINGSVNVIATDVEATNGIIHVIDAVLLP